METPALTDDDLN